jgi:hypothetical protein
MEKEIDNKKPSNVDSPRWGFFATVFYLVAGMLILKLIAEIIAYFF